MSLFQFFKSIDNKNTITKNNNNSSIITLGICKLNQDQIKPTHHITKIYYCNYTDDVTVNIEHNGRVETIILSAEHAQNIGFINVHALSGYCGK